MPPSAGGEKSKQPFFQCATVRRDPSSSVCLKRVHRPSKRPVYHAGRYAVCPVFLGTQRSRTQAVPKLQAVHAVLPEVALPALTGVYSRPSTSAWIGATQGVGSPSCALIWSIPRLRGAHSRPSAGAGIGTSQRGSRLYQTKTHRERHGSYASAVRQSVPIGEHDRKAVPTRAVPSGGVRACPRSPASDPRRRGCRPGSARSGRPSRCRVPPCPPSPPVESTSAVYQWAAPDGSPACPSMCRPGD